MIHIKILIQKIAQDQAIDILRIAPSLLYHPQFHNQVKFFFFAILILIEDSTLN